VPSLTPFHELVLRLPSPTEELLDDQAQARGVRLFLKRDDLIHPDFPGNKWRKLKHNLAVAGGRPLLTFGGAYSNHIRATAAAGHYFGFATIGIIRGEEHLPLNPGLTRAVAHGMTLMYVSRTDYRRRAEPEFIEGLSRRFGDFHLLPEGGSNIHALRGCAELPSEIAIGFDVICCASGTGATLAGIATALAPGRRAIGFSALKGGGFLVDDVRRLQQAYGQVTENWSIETEFHFGGFARSRPDLDDFAADFHRRHGIALDRVYEAKMMSGLITLLARDRFPPGTTIVAVLA
jgi:1-aminocyclopropane-1-carboxylate deaminase